MLIEETDETVQTLHVVKETRIDAPLDIVFDTLLNPAPSAHVPDLKIEPWPGGRWFRDLGNNRGHLWGHVQVIKPPTLLELCGPMFMSYPALSHVQYRLTPEGDGTRLTLTHRAIGLLDPAHQAGVNEGWQKQLAGIREAAEKTARR